MFKCNVHIYGRRQYSSVFKKTMAGVLALLLALTWSLSSAANRTLLSPPDFTFVKAVGGISGEDVGYDIATDASGIVLAGAFGNMVDFGGTTLTAAGSPSDAFVAKYDHSNNLLWVKQGKGGAGGGSEAGNTDARGVTIDASGNVIATGGYVGTGDFDGTMLSSGGASYVRATINTGQQSMQIAYRANEKTELKVIKEYAYEVGEKVVPLRACYRRRSNATQTRNLF
jgi:hypothetical protein